MGTWASVTDNSSCGSNRSSALSSSDGSFLAEADFASAVAKAAELSGLTVVGSTISDPNAGRKGEEREKGNKKGSVSPSWLNSKIFIWFKQRLYAKYKTMVVFLM